MVLEVKLKMQLVKDGEVIFEMPLFPVDWPRKRLERELTEFETDLNRFSKIFAALSNKTRLLMMKKLLEEEDRTLNFAVFMRDLDLNPKLVWDNSRILRRPLIASDEIRAHSRLMKKSAIRISGDTIKISFSLASESWVNKGVGT